MKNIILFVTALAVAGSSGYALQKSLNQPQVKTQVNAALGQQRPEFAALDIDGEMRNIKEWDGK